MYICMYVCMCAGEPIVPGEMCVLEIHKQLNSLGLRIVGGVETQLVSRTVLQMVMWSRLGLGKTATLVLPLLTSHSPGLPSLTHCLAFLSPSPLTLHDFHSPSTPLLSPPLPSPRLLSPLLHLLPSPSCTPLIEGHLYPRHPKGHSSLCRWPTVPR